MTDFSRRNFIKATAGVAAGSAVTGGSALFSPDSQAARSLYFNPEKGAKLTLLRFKPFIPSEDNAFTINVTRFTQTTGIQVEVLKEPLEKIPTRAAEIANAGEGPDMALSMFEGHHLYPDKLLDLSEVGDHYAKQDGWYAVCEQYGKREGHWIALPIGVNGTCIVYRDSWVKEAGFENFPNNFDDFMKMCKALKKNNHPVGFALGNALGDGNTWTHWLLWGFGAKMVNTRNEVVINSKETLNALEYLKELYETFIPGTINWLDPTNNKAFLDEQISVTNNAVSIYVAARRDGKLFSTDIRHANYPVGPVGKPTELHAIYPIMAFAHTKYPNAVKEFIRFMLDSSQYGQWIASSRAYITHTLKSHEKNPVWFSDPEYKVFSKATERMLWTGYEGQLGKASAACLADAIVLKMFTQVASKEKTPKEAIAIAEQSARKHYG
jgi:multiple sugar transport system substrate-binding protein